MGARSPGTADGRPPTAVAPAPLALGRLAVLVGVLVALAPAASAQMDSASVAAPSPAAPVAAAPATAVARPDSVGRSPRGAVVRALAVPGWGQVYNRQPLKAPVAVAGVAGAVAYLVFNQRRYLLYRRATVFAGCQDVPPGPDDPLFELCTETAPAYEDEWAELNRRSFATLAPIRDRARGARDIAVVVVGVAYAFQALDAYVAAELADFDVSEDLAVGLAPTPEGGLLAIRVRL